MAKITWESMAEDFKKRYPTLNKMFVSSQPYDYAKILIRLDNDDLVIYDYDEKKAIFYREDCQVHF